MVQQLFRARQRAGRGTRGGSTAVSNRVKERIGPQAILHLLDVCTNLITKLEKLESAALSVAA